LLTRLGATALSTYLADGLAGELVGELARRRAAVRAVLAPAGDAAVVQEHGFYGCVRLGSAQVGHAQAWLADRGLLLSAARQHDPHLRFCLGADPEVGDLLACFLQWPGHADQGPAGLQSGHLHAPSFAARIGRT
jgi:hypothetical protein